MNLLQKYFISFLSLLMKFFNNFFDLTRSEREVKGFDFFEVKQTLSQDLKLAALPKSFSSYEESVKGGLPPSYEESVKGDLPPSYEESVKGDLPPSYEDSIRGRALLYEVYQPSAPPMEIDNSLPQPSAPPMEIDNSLPQPSAPIMGKG